MLSGNQYIQYLTSRLEVGLVIISTSFGIIGASLSAILSVRNKSRTELRKWKVWYLSRPPLGGVLGSHIVFSYPCDNC